MTDKLITLPLLHMRARGVMIMKKSEGIPPKINTAYNLWLYVIMDTSVANLSSE